jgi:hypothetical protein
MGKGSFVGYETINLGVMQDPYPHNPWQIHMKAKGRWQILKWGKQNGDWGYTVFRDNLTARQATALLILMEEV